MPKGGSGTSTVVCAFAALLRDQRAEARIVDLAGDQPALLGLGAEPTPGVADWLALGPQAPTEALARLEVEVDHHGLRLLPLGRCGPEPGSVAPRGEAGAALAMALRSEATPTVVDLGDAASPALLAVAELADATVLVVRPCYLALRRAVHSGALPYTVGVILVDEPGRALGAREVSDVLGLSVLARIPWRSAVTRATDSGLLASRVPDALRRPLARLAGRWIDLPDASDGAAA